MQDVVEADNFPQAGVDDYFHHLPQKFQNSNSPGVRVPLRYQDYDLPPNILRDLHQLLSTLQPGGKRWTSPQPESPPLDIYLNALRKGVCDLLNCEVGEVAPLPLTPPPSKGFSLLTLNGLTWVGTGLPGGGVGYFRQYIMT